ncbi:MAG: Na/Pi cotransporter family protein [Bacillota bacterium]|nr:Na/Pi cotransporter family protein [Bacillota bacterium]
MMTHPGSGWMLANVVGGLGLFLYGMVLMSDSLQKVAGDRMRRILEVLTTNPLRGVLVGAAVTAIIQSSSATTVMVVSFVNAGLMNLSQAFGVIMGANIGTTMTAQLIAFNLTKTALPICGVGFLVYFVAKRKRIRSLGLLILGFGVLFVGLNTMSEAMKPLRDSPAFVDLMVALSRYPILGVLMGTGMTMLIQSSSATIGLLQAVASQGLITYKAAVPVLFGDNIGTCITAVLASLGTNLTAKRAAIAHVSFNVFGTILFLLLLQPFKGLVEAITPSGYLPRLIANSHTVFNVLNTLVWLPMVAVMVRWVKTVVPGEERGPRRPAFLDPKLYNTPAVALGQVTKELGRMGEMTKEMLVDARLAILNQDLKAIARIDEQEESVDYLQREITVYLTGLGQSSLGPDESTRLINLQNVVHDIERVGDHVKNLAELAEYRIDQRLVFSDAAQAELYDILSRVQKIYSDTLEALANDAYGLAFDVLRQEEEVDALHRTLRTNHIGRLNEGKCLPQSGIVYLDILTNLERVADHSVNIAQAVLDRVREDSLVTAAGVRHSLSES